MEAVPRLPMLELDLKTSPQSPDFSAKLKQYIADCYREDPETYNNELHQLEGLRSAAARPSTDAAGLQALKRYFAQLRRLQTRFPMVKGQPAAVQFSWRDLFANSVRTLADVRFEMACVLYNVGALHTKLGAAESRTSPESMKAACSHFQSAVWAFRHLRETYPQPADTDLCPEAVKMFQDMCLGQAQECILEKSMQDSRKPGIVAAIGAQAILHYKAALSALDSVESPYGTVGSKACNAWIKSFDFKVAYLSCVVRLYQGMQSEEQQRMGERVAHYQAASDKLQEARKLFKGLPRAESIDDTLTFTNDVVEGKRKAAKNENEFIYHEEIPDGDQLTEPKPAPLAKGIPIDFDDPDVSGPDLFARLVPMKAHEASSMYSEEKAKLLRRIGAAVEVKDAALNDFTSSLQLEELNVLNRPERLPDELVDMCASLSVKTEAIKNLVDTMNTLADIHTEVDSMLNDIKQMQEEEEKSEKEFQQIMGKRAPSNVTTELSREANKYLEAHNKANESNQTLHKAMTLHLANLRLLSLPLDELNKHLPSVEAIKDSIDHNAINDMRALVDKVNEMRAQRSMLVLQLREAVNADDITSQLLTRTGESLDDIFKQEIEKHNKTVALIEQNMVAQENILKALTDAYAKYAPSRKIISDILRKRENFMTAMITSYETYEDLMDKSLKGIEFYRKLSSSVSRLFTRLRSLCKVQEEERTQLLASHLPKQAAMKNVPSYKGVDSMPVSDMTTVAPSVDVSAGPKLKDYLPYMKNRSTAQVSNASETTAEVPYMGQMYPPYVRPAPVGSEGSNDVITSRYSDSFNSRMTGVSDNMTQNYPVAQSNIPEQGSHLHHGGGYIPVDPKPYPDPSYSNQNTFNEHYHSETLNAGTVPSHWSQNTGVSSSIVDPKQNPYGVGYVNPQMGNAQNYNQALATNYATPQSLDYSVQNYPNASTTYDNYNYDQNSPYKQNVSNPATASITNTYVQSQPTVPGYSTYDQVTNYNRTQMDPNQVASQMQNLSLANVPQPMGAYGSDAVSSYNSLSYQTDNYPQSGGFEPGANQPGIIPQQNFNINPAHISSTMNLYGQSQFINTNQPNTYPDVPSTGVNSQHIPVPVNTAEVSSPSHGVNPTTNEASLNRAINTGYAYGINNTAYPNVDPNLYNATANPTNTPQIPPNDTSVQSQNYTTSNAANPPNYPYVYYGNTTDNVNMSQQYAQIPNQSPYGENANSYQTHPGYSYNKNTGMYEYSYGYQNNMQNPSLVSDNNSNLYNNVAQHNLYTNAGTYGTVQTASTPVDGSSAVPPNADPNNVYYTVPYGHQSNPEQNATNTVPDPVVSNEQGNAQNGKSLTYMNSNDTTTNTTYSNQGKTGVKSSPSIEDTDSSKKSDEPKEPSTMDLLSGLDFSIEQAPLLPEIKVPPVSEHVIRKTPVKAVAEPAVSAADEETSVPKRPPKCDIFSDPNSLNKFTQEVKSMQLFVDGFTKKTHSGITMLDSKWKKIQENHAKDSSLKTTLEAKNHMENVNSPNVLTFDDSRVSLKSDFNDRFINASHIKQISSWCNPIIVSDLPSEEMYAIFWQMILQERVSIIVCLLTEIELQGKFYGPTAKTQSLDFTPDLSVTLDEITTNVNWTERKLTVKYKKETHSIIHYQINVFPARVVSAPLVMLVDKILNTKVEKLDDSSPLPVILVHCNAGAGRSSLIVLLTMVMSQVRAGYVDLRDMLDSGIIYLCGTRTNVLEDTKYLVDIYRTVLFYVQGVLCSGTVMFNGEAVSVPSGASVPPPHIPQPKRPDNLNKFSKESFEEMKQAAGLKSGDMQDPLSYLDPLWSLKKRKE